MSDNRAGPGSAMSSGPGSAAYWDGAARGVLVLQQCGNCGTIRHYPRVLCAVCRSFEVHPVEVDGTGSVLSWTVTEHAFDPSVASDVPYTLVTVDMSAGVRMLGRLRTEAGQPPEARVPQVREGLPVRLTFEPGLAGRPVPVFVRAAD